MSDVIRDAEFQQIIANTNKLLAEQQKLMAEQQKLSAEQQKLMAESYKLTAETVKLRIERWLTPLIVVFGAIGSLIAGFSVIYRLLS